jgi:hypothetical protein
LTRKIRIPNPRNPKAHRNQNAEAGFTAGLENRSVFRTHPIPRSAGLHRLEISKAGLVSLTLFWMTLGFVAS